MSLFTFNLVLSFATALVLHEVGHWAAARACNVPVTQIGLGWGPKIVGFRMFGVECQLRLLPIGAFTRMDMVVLQRQKLSQQLLVLGAGIGINLFLSVAAWGTAFGFINLALALGNLLPLYQLDGWKSGIVISRQVLGRNPLVEWTFTILGALLAGAFIAWAIWV
jgi:membrane-associated protease RseP (regulator of RpoE activity)